ncbi:hypothetical protein TRFO_28133 [Tritrichomonas foetus]|uniref:Uncharacterized protein n=1 Tax=Tritrichomonas foetus TaxID=1144522 RepID=A0A1J4JYY5_9EUKA|nr:hypothetical protein TRFO_28133 [Tritrichomonas foetus]|eukprot:OHT04369.1 hypothetical protein TRFO_28133 [Tritrichomonas foetus]
MNYNKETDIINEEMSKLMRLAKNARKDDPNYLENEEEEEEEEEDSQRKAEKGKGNENLIDDDGNDDDDEIPVEKEYRNIGLDTEEHIEIEETEIRTENKAPKRRHIGLSVKRRVKKTKPSKDSSGKEQQQDNESEADLDDEDDEPDIEVEEDEGRSKKNPRKRKKVKKGISGLITKMKKTQKKNQNQQAGTQQVVARIDEGKVTQRVLEAVMPRVENLLIDTFSGSNGIGGNGVKLEKNDAKQLITQLSLLDSMKNEVKGLRLKLAMKIDRVKAENELRIRITKDEFFQYLSAFFPENETIKQMVQQPKTSKLPPLNSRKPNIGGNPMSNSSLGQSAENPVTYTKNKQMAKSNLVMRPNRNSNMIALNQKFLKGADGHYYLRDMTTDPNSIQAVQGSMFGENSEDVDINAVLDFQPFKQVSTDDHDIRVNPNVVKVHREETPEV